MDFFISIIEEREDQAMDIKTVDSIIRTIWKIVATCRALYLLFWKKDRDVNDLEKGFMWLAVSAAIQM